jgi:UDP-N-acetylglucosamine 2-epimerase (non-hydrolysing)
MRRGQRYPPPGVKIVYAMGARPNFVKMAPLISELRGRLPEASHIVVHTGQHYDRMMSDVFVDELAIPAPDYVLGVGSATHAVQTARVIERIEPVLEANWPDLVFVPGDVNSTLAVALVAVKLGISLAHLESGLRSFDRSMPEEINRIVADEFSDYLFIHCEDAHDNLRAEGIEESRIHFVGNTMIDTLVALEPRFRGLDQAGRLGLSGGEYLLVTLHRPALVDGPLLQDVLDQLGKIAVELPVVFPAHPRTRKKMSSLSVAPGVHILDPIGYLEFLSLEADAAAVLTDSGGVQEETTHLGVPCFTLRDNTERPVTIREGTNTLLGLNPARIADIVPALRSVSGTPAKPLPGWDGNAATRVAEVICGDPDAARSTPEPASVLAEGTGATLS